MNLTFTDKILKRTLLPFIPRFITPNMVTVFRFIMILPVVYLLAKEEYGLAIFAFFLASFSDAIDGSLARTRNKITEWGKMYDPLADKILVGSSAFILVSRYLNVYLAATIILIEFFIVVSAYYRKRVYGVPIEAEMSGKVKMVLQSLGLLSLLFSVFFHSIFFLSVAEYLLYLSIVFAIISLVVYKSI